MNKNDYEKATLELLTDTKFYKEEKTDPNPIFADKVGKCIEDMKDNGILNENEYQYLYSTNYVTPYLYTLPKIHKSFLEFPQLRPIVAGCNSCCVKISHFIDFYLQPMAKKVNSYCKDTTHFLHLIKEVECREGDIIVSAEVSGLYNVIDHQEGIDACNEALNQRSRDEQIKMPTKYLIKLIGLVLKCNYFSFAGRFFHQILGTAMGTPMAPAYANIFLGRIEKELLKEYKALTGIEPIIWIRYLDDIFFLWRDGSGSLKHFQKFMQEFSKRKNMNTNLEFTFEAGKSVPFLDTMVYLDNPNNRLKSTLYHKKTDADLYVRADSCHPTTCKNGLVKAELL